MNREYAKQEIRRRWREIMPGITDQAPGKMNGEKSWVCPLCRKRQRATRNRDNQKPKSGKGTACIVSAATIPGTLSTSTKR